MAKPKVIGPGDLTVPPRQMIGQTLAAPEYLLLRHGQLPTVDAGWIVGMGNHVGGIIPGSAVQ